MWPMGRVVSVDLVCLAVDFSAMAAFALAAPVWCEAAFRVQYMAAGRRENLPLASTWSNRFEDAGPIRRLMSVKGQANFSGLYYAATTGTHVGFESWLERDVLMELDFDRAVTGFSSQPFQLTWQQNGRQRRHIHMPAPSSLARPAAQRRAQPASPGPPAGDPAGPCPAPAAGAPPRPGGDSQGLRGSGNDLPAMARKPA
jgi:hypothetical protein